MADLKKIKGMKIDLKKFNPCDPAMKYYNEKESFKEAWNDCHRGDWLLWIASRLDIDHRTFVLAKALCAETVIHLMQDERSVNAVKIAKKYGKGEATDEELRVADDAATAADDDAAAADDAAAYYAASAYSYAATAAAFAAADDDDADAAAAAAAAAAFSAAANTYAKTKTANQLKTANICREILTKQVFEKLNVKN